MKYIKIFLFFIIIMFGFKCNVHASEYTDVDKGRIPYDINNFKLVNDYIMINGWAVGDNNQQMSGDDTHEYSLEVTNKKTGQVKIYNAIKHNVDKTQLMRDYTSTRQAGYWELRADTSKVYYLLSQVGFEFRIPLTELPNEGEYGIKLRLYSKLVNTKTQTPIYAFNINSSYTQGGYKYELYSDLLNSGVLTTSTYLYVRTGPGTGYSVKQSRFWSGLTGSKMYWYPYMNYSNVRGASQTNPGDISSETWVNIGLDDNGLYDNRARAWNGNSDSGWTAWVYLIGTGKPAAIRVTRISNTTINNIKSYTTQKNTNGNVIVNLKNNINQKVNLKLYQDGTLKYNQDHTFEGTKDITINYNVPNSGNIKIIATEPNGLQAELNSKIYVSSTKEYILTENKKTITPENPVMVYTDKNGTNNYYENITVEVPYTKISIVNGKGFDSWVKISYSSNISGLNTDITSKIYYPNQENNLNYSTENNMVVVNMNKESSNNTNNTFNIDQYVMNKKDGTMYISGTAISNVINAGKKWYPNMKMPLGDYDYYYNIENIGINKIKFKINCEYTTVKSLFGTKSKFNIKRVDVPSSLNKISEKSYTYQELIERYGD
ncbi:MAG: hypothetical protein PHD15_02160 [Clostridia bacterium]|nr:hypothetical protein [Clostridia bacterium]MDD4386552.1 hypothetical protein [Clostridia bacterium]